MEGSCSLHDNLDSWVSWYSCENPYPVACQDHCLSSNENIFIFYSLGTKELITRPEHSSSGVLVKCSLDHVSDSVSDIVHHVFPKFLVLATVSHYVSAHSACTLFSSFSV